MAITKKIKDAILEQAQVNPNALDVWRKVSEEIGNVSYPTVLKTIKQAGIALTGSAAAASERMKRLNADPDFAAAASERMKRLHADPDFASKNAAAASERMKRLHADPAFEKKRIAGIRRAKKPGQLNDG